MTALPLDAGPAPRVADRRRQPAEPQAAVPPATSAVPAGAAAGETSAAEVPRRWRFALAAEADPGMLPRLMEPFAKRGLVPERWAARTTGDGDEALLSVRCTVGGLTARQAETVAAFLAGVPGVVRVARDGDPAGRAAR